MCNQTNVILPPPPEGKTGWPWTNDDFQDEYDKPAEPKISIVTPSFNQGQFIEETIRSVLLQKYKNFEYIIMDGGSSDNTLEIIQKYKDNIAYWASEPDRGQTHAINKGLALATGDIIAYLNSDDIYLPDTFIEVVHFFNQNPDIDMLYGDLVHIDKQSNIIDIMRCDTLDQDKLFSFHYYFPQASVFLRKGIIQKIGFFDENLHLNMDYDYWIRLSFDGKMAHIPRTLACARLYPEAKSQFFSQNYLQENLIILNKYEDRIKTLKNADVMLSHSYASVYYYGGVSYIKGGKFSLGLKCIRKAVQFKKTILIDIVFIYAIICGFFGEKHIYHIVSKTLRRIGFTSVIYHR